MLYSDLRKAGVCPLAMKITRCITETGNNHAVLILNGEHVLDNRQKAVVMKKDLDYKWKSWFNFWS